MIDTIINFGGEVYFDKICTDLILEKDEQNNFFAKMVVSGYHFLLYIKIQLH